MARWRTDAASRLRDAALDLCEEHGYERVTVADIARAAGVTQRTFYNHYERKRDVLFTLSEDLEATVVRAMEDAPADLAPLRMALHGLRCGAEEWLGPNQEALRRRARVIAAHAELRDGQDIRSARLAGAMTQVLVARGSPRPLSGLVCSTAVAAFGPALARWSEPGQERTLSELLDELLGQLQDQIDSSRLAGARIGGRTSS